MDVLRSCYQTKFRPFVDSDQEYTIRWYPAPEGAKIMEGHHLYASSNWIRDKTMKWEGPGEVEGAEKQFLTGRNPPFYLGQCRLGTKEQWEQGVSVDVLDTPHEEMPECCTIFPPPFVGLSILGATTFLYYRIPGRKRLAFTLAGLGDTGGPECSNLNRDYILEQDAANLATYRQIDTVPFSGGDRQWVFQASIGPPPAAAFQTMSITGSIPYAYELRENWDGNSPITLSLVFAPSCSGVPATVTLTPVP